MAEPLAYGGIVGETFNCLMSEVFVNLKYGDRFFYETKNQKNSFLDGGALLSNLSTSFDNRILWKWNYVKSARSAV